MKYTIRKRFNPNHDDKGLFASGAGGLAETNGTPPKVGDSFLVYRAGSPTGTTLAYKNGGNAQGVAHHLVNIDGDGPKYVGQANSSKDLVIHAFKVTLTEPVSGYRMYNDGKSTSGGMGNDVTRMGYITSKNGDAYAFGGEGRGYTSEYLGSVPAKTVLDHLLTTHTGPDFKWANNFDSFGSNLAAAAIRDVVGKAIRAKKFNPNHDEKGRFSSGGGTPDSATTLSVPNTNAMMTLMRHMARNPDQHPNIINLSVGGDKIFHPEKSLGIPRIDMPQIPSAARDAYLSSLRATVTSKSLDPTTLYPIQKELDGYKTSKFATQTNTHNIMPVVSRDNYIIDGHHNWAGAVVRAQIDPNVRILSHVVDMDHAALLDATRAYSHSHGFAAKPIYKAAKYTVRVKFNPYHDAQGQFASGQGELALVGGHGYKPQADPMYLEDIKNVADPDTEASKIIGEAMTYRDKTMSYGEHGALSAYQTSDYLPMNMLARAGIDVSKAGTNNATDRQIADVIQAAESKFSETNDWDQPGWAEADTQIADNVHALDQALNNAPALPDGMTLYRAFRNADVVARGSDMVGQKFADAGYLSTSLNANMVKGFFSDREGSPDSVVMRLTTKDANGLYLTAGPQNPNPYEYEVLFDRNTPVKVTGVTPLIDGGILIDGEISSSTHKQKFNPNHKPGGGPDGGQFAPVYDKDVVGDFNQVAGLDPSKVQSYTNVPQTDKSTAFNDAHATNHRKMIMDHMGSDARTALANYQGAGYRNVNNVLRDPSSVRHPEDWQALADDVHKAFNYALPIPDGTETWRAFRSADVVAQAEAGTLVGQTFTDKGFLSTSTNPYVVSDFFDRKYALAGSPAVAMRITTTNGAKAIYLGSTESELLFDKGTPVTITGASKTPHGLWVVDGQIKGQGNG